MRLLALFSIFFIRAVFAAESPTLHPQASALHAAHQGPFVTTADGGVLCIDSKNALRSADEGRTWSTSPLFAAGAKFAVSNERALLRTREGVIISAWMNGAERKTPPGWHWGEKSVKWTDFILPTYSCRSTDDGKTWQTPVKLSDPWCGCIHSMIQLKSGRIVLVGQEIIAQWRHATVMWVSDDLGQSWQRGDVLDYGIGEHDHAGSLEGSVVERADGSLYLLLRTESGFLWEATSRDGLKWGGLKQTAIKSVTCCPQMARLSDGRIALLWNASPRHNPSSGSSRAELSLAFSSDEAATWSKPIIVAANYAPAGRVSYPYLYERKPGELWITTMQGGLRMRVETASLSKGEIPVFVPPPQSVPKPGGIFMFGDSTTAARGTVKVYAERVNIMLQSIGSSLSVYNAGKPSDTTAQAVKRLQTDVLAYKPRIVVMQFGINDSAVDVWRKPPASTPRVSLESYTSNYRSMILAAQKSGAKVILMTTNPLRWTSKLIELYGKPPYDPESEGGFEKPHLLAYNDAVRALAKELKVTLVDVYASYPEFTAKKKLTVSEMIPDGMHPGDSGQELVSQLLLPAIRSLLR
ncbi:MAG: exo-alpha-sialidase [Verrucomicrobiaceae bacterium]|nr:exo-alpha-sialidase [Verrucomicrobiaceae bacterium]